MLSNRHLVFSFACLGQAFNLEVEECDLMGSLYRLLCNSWLPPNMCRFSEVRNFRLTMDNIFAFSIFYVTILKTYLKIDNG